MTPSRRMTDQFKMFLFAQFIFNETKIIIIHKKAEWETTITIKTNTCLLRTTLSLLLSFLCSICSEAIIMAVPGPHSLYTNRVNAFWQMFPVYNKTLLSLCGFCWAAFKWWKWEVSWGVRWVDGEGEDCFVCLGGASFWAMCQKAILFKFRLQDLKW